MGNEIDREVQAGFIHEARGYLPKIRQAIDMAAEDPTNLEKLGEAHRLTHSIKGASSMMGLEVLSHMAFLMEEVLELVGVGQMGLDSVAVSTLQGTVDAVEYFLAQTLAGNFDEGLLFGDVVRAHRRLRKLPESEDDQEISRLLSSGQESLEVATEVSPPSAFPMPSSSPGPSTEAPSQELLEVFLQEAEDHLQTLSGGLRDLEKAPDNRRKLQETRRVVHTLKGAAGMVGFAQMSQLAHRMEDLLDQIYEGGGKLSQGHLDLLFQTSDTLGDMAAQAGAGSFFGDGLEGEAVADGGGHGLSALYERYRTALELARPEEEEKADLAILEPPIPDPSISEPPIPNTPAVALSINPSATTDVRQVREPVTPELVAHSGPNEEKNSAAQAAGPTSQIVRVPIERLDELVRLVSELVVSQSTFEQYFRHFVGEAEELRLSTERLQQVSGRFETEFEVLALSQARTEWPKVAAAGGGYSNVQALPLTPSSSGFSLNMRANDESGTGFDALELDRYTDFHLLARELSETSSDLGAVGNEFRGTIANFDSYLNRASGLTSEVQDKLMHLRMVPLSQLASRLYRTVRVTAGQRDKKVDLEIDGEQTELDKTVLEELSDPLLHLIRNAVDHGIESPVLRQALGKPERGQIRLRAFTEGTNIALVIEDDGSGIDPQKLRQKAIKDGYMTEADAENASEAELHALIFLPGFSTAAEVSEISGRGVGLDVVKSNLRKIKGTVTVSSRPGEGTTFSIRLPMTLAITRVLMVRCGDESLAIPLASISQILRLEREEVEQLGQEPVVRFQDKVYPAMQLRDFFGLKPSVEAAARLPVLILDLGDQHLALIVDQIMEAREVVVKTLGNLLRHIRGVTGATLMGDGSAVLILNPSELVKEPEGTKLEPKVPIRLPQTPTRRTLDIMVVDDSVSVRRVLSNLVRNAGWNPIIAKDGLEALEVLQRSPRSPDILLLDIEMPRMDGYELTSALRAQEAYQGIPIMMLTSRAGEKHRRRAFELGATEYLVKPYQDETLLATIRRLVGTTAPSGVAENSFGDGDR